MNENISKDFSEKLVLRRRSMLAGLGSVGASGAAAMLSSSANASPTPIGTVIDALQNGVKADGVSDDYAALQSLINRATSDNPVKINLPAGRIKLSKPLSIPYSPYTKIFGAGMGLTILLPPTNQPLFLFQKEDSHSLEFRNFSVLYPSGSELKSGSKAFFYSSPNGTLDGWYHHKYSDIYIENCYDAWSVDDAQGKQTVWDSDWQNIILGGVGRTAFSFAPAVPIGMPINRFRSIGIFNTNTNVKNIGPAFNFLATEAIIEGLDIEGWRDEIVSTVGGGYVRVSGAHVEHHKFTKDKSTTFSFSDGVALVENFTISGQAELTNGTYLTICSPDNSFVTLRNGVINSNDVGGPVTTNPNTITEIVFGGRESQTVTVENVTIVPESGFNNIGTGKTSMALWTARWAPAPDAVRTTVQTSNYKTTPRDGLVVMKGSNLTINLTPSRVGQPLIIKNVSTTILKVVPPTGSMIDNKSSINVAANDSVTVRWIGESNWITTK